MTYQNLLAPIRYPPPEHCTLPTRQPPPAADTPERAGLDTILAHFKDDSLKMAVSEDSKETRELDDLEKMFLVRARTLAVGRAYNDIMQSEEMMLR